MFGISPLGWLHTLGSLPAIPLALYMLVRHGRIVPRSGAGVAYFLSMLVGALTVFLVARQPVSVGIGLATLLLLLAGYALALLRRRPPLVDYVETVLLSLTVFLLMVPTVSETLRRVPDGHPLVTDLGSPVLLGAQALLLLMLLAGVGWQLTRLRRQARSAIR
ncbi:hypothetical protein [Herbaspirillum sp. YR522]|uniref:hypothetical protein n=1 Tax=Herbaspirillum sp. YR522 TaxID=1144342 RepID=UPI00026F995F|nr:hypothetical protein [Herbaspirillum sp. YR522]EJN09859.1 hypothetical protein PMI40_00404 [Herbaspirillum sp. YR522]